jgi:dolichol-phosphate mannosyltransferase
MGGAQRAFKANWTKPGMLSIIIPTYNEAANIRRLIEELAVATAGLQSEVIVVDDNSQDGTAALAESCKAMPVRVVRRAGKMGLASAVVDGAKQAHGDIMVVIDADLSHPPSKVPELVTALNNADIAVGSRYAAGGGITNWPATRRITSKGATLIARTIFGLPVRDPVSGFFAVRRDLFLRTPVDVQGYKILLNLLVKNPAAKVAEVPFVFTNRKVGKSKLGVKEITNYVKDVRKLLSR